MSSRRHRVQSRCEGVYEDRGGPILVEALRAHGCTVDGPVVVRDGDPVEAVLRDGVVQAYDVVVPRVEPV